MVVSVQFLLTNKAYTTMPSGADAETSFMSLLHKSGKYFKEICLLFHVLLKLGPTYNYKVNLPFNS